jgi:zinc and cadmium transporter
MDLIVFLVLFFPVVLSGISVFFIRAHDRVLKLITAFSGAYLLAISFMDIIPEIYTENKGIEIGLFILAGFFIQLLLEYITKGVEHGHQHHDCEEQHPNQRHSGPHIPIVPVMIGIFIHSFLEGMPLADSLNMPQLRNTLLTGIAIHNIPLSIVLMSLLLSEKKKGNIRAIIFLLVFAIAGPLGVFTSNLIGLNMAANSHLYFSIIMAMVVGIFLHISTTILFETDEHHRFNWLKFTTIILGCFVAYLVA